MTPSSELLPGVPLIESPLFHLSIDNMELTDQERDIAVQLNEHGYAVFDFPDEQIDARIDRVKAALAPSFDIDFSAKNSLKNKGDFRLQDAWKHNEDVRDIACNRNISQLLSKLYGRRAFPFQTLNFPIGTQQHMHSDSVHFSSIPERFMCGVWLAMEDIDADSGPLVYYPGSHKWPILTNDMLNIRGKRDKAKSAQTSYEPVWQALVKATDAKPANFYAKKGQALIWAANLLHGGSRQNDLTLTRWSQVTHYYFYGCSYYTPAYSNPSVGKLELRHIRNIETGELVDNIYIDRPIRQILRKSPTQYVKASSFITPSKFTWERIKRLFRNRSY